LKLRALLLPALLLAACKAPPSAPPDPEWEASLKRFQTQRAESIAGPDGWLTLIGRFAIDEGLTTLGSALDGGVVLPPDRAPPQAGSLTTTATEVRFTAAADAGATLNGAPVQELVLTGEPSPLLELGSLRMHVIKRGKQRFLRVRDREHPARANFEGLKWYPPAPQWRLRARLETADAGATTPILNVLGQTEATPLAGALLFEVDGRPQRLTALAGEGGELFVLFKDETSGHGSYPSGRFLDAPAPNAQGEVELDFNRAYNPPCAFTAFATCPVPPRGNALPLRIEAGERYTSH
jgi:uncharacterized protein (DUF1684 family)